MLLCWLFHALQAVTAPPADHPAPVILISIDTLRADHLSCYGYRRVRTPHIDSLAANGTLFSAINSQVPLTFPSHVSLFTSTYPFFSAIEDNGEALKPAAVTLASVLKSHAYRTGAFVGGFVLDRRFGLNQGFDDYDSTFPVRRGTDTDPGDIKRLGADVVRSATRWLDSNSGTGFFLFVHLYDLHTPYNLPAAYRARYGTGYDAELRYVDDQVGSLLEYLQRRGLYDRVLTVLVSDHGESLGEHGEKTHGYFIYQSTMWVPMIIHWPSEGHSPAGGHPPSGEPASRDFPARDDDPAGLIDVAPTILQVIGIPRPLEFQGRSLLETLHSGSLRPVRDVYSESLYAHNHFGCSALRSVRAGKYKYIQAPEPELYDLIADPGETLNLYNQNRSLAVVSQQRLASIRDRFRSARPLGGRVLDPDAIARLRSLGYVALSSGQPDSPEKGADPKRRIAAYEDYGRALVLAASGRLSESNSLLEQLIHRYPDVPDLRLTLGLNHQKAGQHEAAANEFQQILSADPLNTQAHFDLGLSFYALHRLDDAVRELDTTLTIAPYYTRAEELLGTIWLQKGDFRRARDRFIHLLSVDPSDYTAHYNLGALAILESDWDSGEQHLRAAVHEQPDNPEAHNTLGSLYLREGKSRYAVAEFQQAIRLRPGFASAHYNLGLAFNKLNRPNDAASEFRKAAALDPRLHGQVNTSGGRASSPN